MGCGATNVIKDNTKKGNNEVFVKRQLIGKGNLGEVYLAQSTKEKTIYALKEIIIKNINEEIISKEAENLYDFDHPNVLYFKNAFLTKSTNSTNSDILLLNIISEYAEKGDIGKVLSRHQKENIYFVENQLLDWLIQNCLALVYLHDKKIIHGDIKPSNIFLTKNNSIKLGDFGNFKKCLNLDYNNVYLPPEFIEKKEYSYAGDIWSLGATFCHLITLEFPFEGNNKDEIYENILKGNKNKNILNKEKNNYNQAILDIYNKELLDLIDEMISIDPLQRPLAEDILKANIIKKRMNECMEENNYDTQGNNEVYASIRIYTENLAKKRSKYKESVFALDAEKSVKK